MGTAYTKYTNLEATGDFKAATATIPVVTGSLVGSQKGAILGSALIAKAVDYALTAAEKANLVLLLTMTAGSKTYTLGLAARQIALVYNAGSTTFTFKNVEGDTGTLAATTKAFLVVGSATANASTVIALN